MTTYSYSNDLNNNNRIQVVKDCDIDPITGGYIMPFTYTVDSKSKPSKNQLDHLNKFGWCYGKRIDDYTVVF